MKPSPFGKQALKKWKDKYENSKYELPKWIQFCEYYMNKGFEVQKYQARHTVSKYIYLTKDNKTVKVRFSNHKPNYNKQATGDCDFFVGVSNGTVITTKQVALLINKLYGIGEQNETH